MGVGRWALGIGGESSCRLRYLGTWGHFGNSTCIGAQMRGLALPGEAQDEAQRLGRMLNGLITSRHKR